MASNSVFTKYPKLSLLIITLMMCGILLLLTELVLRFTPFQNIIRSDIGFPHMWVADEQAGYDLKENFKSGTHKTIDIDYNIHSNSLGCYDEERIINADYNILIGDSFTWGFSPLEKKWTTALEKSTNTEFVKCGVPAYGVKQSLAKLKKIIRKTGQTPKRIVFSYYWNDLNDDYTGLPAATVYDGIYINKIKSFDYRTGDIKYLTEQETQARYDQFKQYGNPDYLSQGFTTKVKFWIKDHSILANLAHNYLAALSSRQGEPEAGVVEGNNAKYDQYLVKMDRKKYPWINKAWQQHLANIDELVDFAKQNNSAFLFVIIPTKAQIYPAQINPNLLENIEKSRRLLKNHLATKGVKYLDLQDGFIETATHQENSLYLANDLHWSFEGEATAGKLIADFMKKNNFLKTAN